MGLGVKHRGGGVWTMGLWALTSPVSQIGSVNGTWFFSFAVLILRTGY